MRPEHDDCARKVRERHRNNTTASRALSHPLRLICLNIHDRATLAGNELDVATILKSFETIVASDLLCCFAASDSAEPAVRDGDSSGAKTGVELG